MSGKSPWVNGPPVALIEPWTYVRTALKADQDFRSVPFEMT
jgi:hypothetical protein